MSVSSRPPIKAQVNSLAVDMMALQTPTIAADRDHRAVAISVAHAALILAVSLAADDEDRFVREDILYDVMPLLDGAGLGHVTPLIKAALKCDFNAARIARGVERPQ